MNVRCSKWKECQDRFASVRAYCYHWWWHPESVGCCHFNRSESLNKLGCISGAKCERKIAMEKVEGLKGCGAENCQLTNPGAKWVDTGCVCFEPENSRDRARMRSNFDLLMEEIRRLRYENKCLHESLENERKRFSF